MRCEKTKNNSNGKWQKSKNEEQVKRQNAKGKRQKSKERRTSQMAKRKRQMAKVKRTKSSPPCRQRRPETVKGPCHSERSEESCSGSFFRDAPQRRARFLAPLGMTGHFQSSSNGKSQKANGKSQKNEEQFNRQIAKRAAMNLAPTARLGSASSISSFDFPVSNFGFRISIFQFRFSSFQFPASIFQFRTSGFQFRFSSFDFPVANFQLRFSNFVLSLLLPFAICVLPFDLFFFLQLRSRVPFHSSNRCAEA